MKKLSILVVDDELAMRESIAAWLQEDGHLPGKAGSGEEALRLLRNNHYDVALIDFKMPVMDGQELLLRIREEHPEVMVIMITAFGSIESAVQAMKAGAYDYLLKPFDPQQLIFLLERIARHRRLVDHNLVLREALAQGQCPGFENMVIASQAMIELFDLLDHVARTSAPVLILGETGTGKELAARAIHQRSDNAEGHFVPLNCGAQSESILESELFGHERGAFTGAVKARRGRLEMADGGVLFLDEVGEIPPKMQIQLLRVLEDGRFQRVGGNGYLTSEFRLISATHSDLPSLIERKLFRQDFFYRINVITLEIPPLRDRIEEIKPLAEHFLQVFSRQTGKRLSGLTDRALEVLRNYSWPGNVRELRNVIERAVILGAGEQISHRELRFFSTSAEGPAAHQTLAAMEKYHINRMLDSYDWNISLTSKKLGVDRSTLARKIKQYGLDQKNSQPGEPEASI